MVFPIVILVLLLQIKITIAVTITSPGRQPELLTTTISSSLPTASSPQSAAAETSRRGDQQPPKSHSSAIFPIRLSSVTTTTTTKPISSLLDETNPISKPTIDPTIIDERRLPSSIEPILIRLEQCEGEGGRGGSHPSKKKPRMGTKNSSKNHDDDVSVRRGATQAVNLILIVNHPPSNPQTTLPAVITLKLTSGDPALFTVLNHTVSDIHLPAVARGGGQKRVENIVLVGKFLGYSTLRVQLYLSTTTTHEQSVDQEASLSRKGDDGQYQMSPIQSTDFPVSILRSRFGMYLGHVFTIVVVILIIINNFFMGTQLDLDIIQATIRKPVGPAIGFVCQFMLMPLISFFWGFIILRDWPNLQLGYFAIGCSPGGGNSNFWTILLDGNIDLSVTMTFFSNLAAFVMMPFWLYTLGRVFYPEIIHIPFRNIGLSMTALILPCMCGILFRYLRPEFTKLCRKLVKIISMSILVFILTFGTYANLYIFFLIKWYTIVCGFLLPWTGYGISYTVAWLLGMDYSSRITIAIETGIQNGGIAIVLLRFSLMEPESDLTLVMPICVMLFTSVPLWGLFVYNHLFKHKSSSPFSSGHQPKNDEIRPTVPGCSTDSAVKYTVSLDTESLSVSTGYHSSYYDNKAAEFT